MDHDWRRRRDAIMMLGVGFGFRISIVVRVLGGGARSHQSSSFAVTILLE